MSSEAALLRAVDNGDVDLFYKTKSRSLKLWVTDDQGRTPLEIARFWLSVDYETELRRRLGVGGGDAVTVERLRVPDSGLGWWERIRVTAPDGRSLEVGTGHVGFVTELEKAFGIRASCGELADRALALADDDHACWGPQMYELVRRDDEPTLDALELMLDIGVQALLKSGTLDPALAADLAAQMPDRHGGDTGLFVYWWGRHDSDPQYSIKGENLSIIYGQIQQQFDRQQHS